jgi:DNA-binding NtrC family response regulator
MQPVTILLIADDMEATVMCVALAKRRDVRVIEAPNPRHAIKLLEKQDGAPTVAISGTAALAKNAHGLVKILEARRIPLVVIAGGLSEKAKQRALGAGVKEIHERPRDWHTFSKLIDAVISRFGCTT